MGMRSALQLVELTGFILPFFGIRQGPNAARDDFPLLRELGIDLDEVHLIFGKIFFGVNGFDRAFGYADGAVNALVGIDDQEVGANMETVDGTDVDAIGITASDTSFGYDVSHEKNLSGVKIYNVFGAIVVHCRNVVNTKFFGVDYISMLGRIHKGVNPQNLRHVDRYSTEENPPKNRFPWKGRR